MAKDDDILEEARELFERCEEREADNRDEALDDLEFARLARQWRVEDEEQRAAEGRPCLTINRMPAFIRQVVNDARQNTPTISVRAVDDAADPATAEVMSDLIRDIEAQSSADIAYDTAVDFAVSCGFGYFRINTAYVDDDAFEQDIRIARIANPFSVYGDPFSDAPDSSDWNVAFVLDRMKRSVFEKRYADADPASWSDPRWDQMGEPWKQDGDYVGVAEYWTREQVKKPIVALSNASIVAVKEYEKHKALFDAQGVSVVGSPREVVSHKVTQRLISGCDVLETVEWAGKCIPIVPVYGEDINVAGTRYLRSLIRDAKDPQRMFNYWRTASTELVALARAGALNAVGDAQQRNQQARADADYDEFMRMIGYPAQQQQLRNQALGMMPIQQTTTSTSKSSPGFMDILGGIAGGAASLGWKPFSDMRVKENIRTIGHDRHGRRWVEFNYRWEPPEMVRQGVIAQEILKTDPEAVVTDSVSGLYRVDYTKLEDGKS